MCGMKSPTGRSCSNGLTTKEMKTIGMANSPGTSKRYTKEHGNSYKISIYDKGMMK